jgi:DNA topoisomerase IB
MSDLPLLTDLRKLQEDVHEALPYHNDKVADDLMQAFDDICKRVVDLQDEIAALRARLEAIYSAKSFMAVRIENRPGPVTPILVIERPETK